MLTGHIGRIDGTGMMDATFSFIGDGRLLQSFDIRAGDLPGEISVFVEDVHLLRVEVSTPPPGRRSNLGYAFVGFVE
ncbi:MAG: hypothetical protein LBE35_05925 [Clostridiales bacterium]|jgi:hypothetical protein|nr:hypothetical protein [Clostridiales bacterium]